MRITFYGVRGSSPTPEPDRMRWGGETTCFLVESRGGTRVVVDAGTGLRRLGTEIAAGPPGRLPIVFTHFHLDHLMGLAAFGPLYTPGWRLDFMAVPRPAGSVGQILSALLAGPFWPVGMEGVPAEVAFHDLPASGGPAEAGGLVIGDLRLGWAPVAHPQGCFAYRFDETGPAGACLAVATDMEWPLEADRAGAIPVVRLLGEPRPVDLAIIDGHFTDDEYPGHQGWGHSSPQHALELARRAGVERVVLTHHAPEHDDLFLDGQAAACRRRGLDLARQGTRLTVGGGPP